MAVSEGWVVRRAGFRMVEGRRVRVCGLPATVEEAASSNEKQPADTEPIHNAKEANEPLESPTK